MQVSQKGLQFIKDHEGLRLTSYRDSVGVWTIGHGNTIYPDLSKVKKGQSITKEEAERILSFWVNDFADGVGMALEISVTQNQFDALVAFAYNIGMKEFEGSTVLKKVNKNPNDPTIRNAFMMWNKGTINGKKVVIDGLTNRRKAEADMYFSQP